MSYLAKRNFKSVLVFTAITTGGAFILAVLLHGFNYYAIRNNLIIGFLFGLITSVVEIYYFEDRLRRVKFFYAKLIRLIFYLIVCAVITLIAYAANLGEDTNLSYNYSYFSDNSNNFLKSDDFIELLMFCLFLGFFANFLRQINRLLGQNVLMNHIRGKYQPAAQEELIFMFIDLKSSTTIAEKLGLELNHEFLNDFFHDMTDSILECKSTIYQYVGDEIVLTWTVKNGINNLHCVDVFFHIIKQIDSKKELYLKKYGVYPEFKAGLHIGKVIVGEMGDVKKDLVYHGDTMNTTARIQSECNAAGKIFLASGEIIGKLDLDGRYKTESIGFIKLRGKENELELFSIEEK